MTAERDTVWNKIFAESGRVFGRPHRDLPLLVDRMRAADSRKVLDVGSGTGRHLVFFASLGFETHGIDNSREAVRQAESWLRDQGLNAQVKLHDIATRFPYPDGYFDAVISVQVIHHAVIKTVQAVADEIDRVCRPGAILFVTVPAVRNQGRQFQEVEPNTFVPLDGPERGLPHHFFTPVELSLLFARFQQLDIHMDDINHLCFTAAKRA